MTTIRLIVGITAGYGYAITTLLDMMPTVKLACWNWLIMGKM